MGGKWLTSIFASMPGMAQAVALPLPSLHTRPHGRLEEKTSLREALEAGGTACRHGQARHGGWGSGLLISFSQKGQEMPAALTSSQHALASLPSHQHQ